MRFWFRNDVAMNAAVLELACCIPRGRGGSRRAGCAIQCGGISATLSPTAEQLSFSNTKREIKCTVSFLILPGQENSGFDLL